VYSVSNSWGSGFTGAITLTNDGASAINGWEVSWGYSGNTQVTNLWNAVLSGSNPYSASDMGWNATIAPGQSISFGFQGAGAAEVPLVTGDICR